MADPSNKLLMAPISALFAPSSPTPGDDLEDEELARRKKLFSAARLTSPVSQAMGAGGTMGGFGASLFGAGA